MSRYADGDARRQTAESVPHPDCDDNARFFNRMIEKVVVFSPSFGWEVQDSVIEPVFNPSAQKYENKRRVKEYKTVLFYWPVMGEKMFTTLSFHEKNGYFKETLAWFLNRMGQLGLITKKGLAEEKKYNESKGRWDTLFGK